MAKFKKTLVGRVHQEEENKLEQKQLKEKYRVDQKENVLIVEKNNMFKFLVRTGGKIVRIAADVIIFFLSLVGLSALIYPATREILTGQAVDIMSQMKGFL